MRVALLPVLAFAIMGAGNEAEIETLHPKPELTVGDGITTIDRLLHSKGSVILGAGEMKDRQDYLRSTCRDKIERTQEDGEVPILDAPLFQREPATPEAPLAIYAVDRREDGCAVMVMLGDPTDVRPLPSLSAEDHRLMPADGNED